MADTTRNGRPEVGSWYRDPLDRRFEVVAVDEESGLIQVTYQDGESGELTLADWRHAMVDHDAAVDDVLTSPEEDEER